MTSVITAYLLDSYIAARRRAAASGMTRATDLVALLLKKWLFSSPPAFARTLAAHVDSVRQASGPTPSEPPGWLEDALSWDEDLLDDEAGTEAENARRSATTAPRSALGGPSARAPASSSSICCSKRTSASTRPPKL